MFNVDLTNATTNIDEILGLTPTAHVFLILLTTVIVILGIVGNGIVLYGSIRYRAIGNMDKVGILLLENLAAADIMVTILRPLPMLITLCFNSWVLGPALCIVNGVIRYIPGGFEAFLTAAISLHRMHVLTHPLSSYIPSLKVKVSLACMWSFCFVYFLVPVLAVDSVVYVIPRRLMCGFSLVNIKHENYHHNSYIVILFFMIIAILISNIIILIIAARRSAARTGRCVAGRCSAAKTGSSAQLDQLSSQHHVYVGPIFYHMCLIR